MTPAEALATRGRLIYLLDCVQKEALRGLKDKINPHASLRRIKLLTDPEMGDYSAPTPADALRVSLEALATKWEWEATSEGKPPHWMSPAGICAETLTACATDIRAALAAAGERT